MDWHAEFEKKIVSAEFAASLVRSGDLVAMPVGRDPLALGLALAARKDELRGVRVIVRTPNRDFGWYDPGWESSFEVTISFALPVAAEALAARRVDLLLPPMDFSGEHDHLPVDVAMLEVSPPDKQGFCGFGVSLWDKREMCRHARLAIAEMNPNLIRTCGENFIHFSEIDYFVEHQSSGKEYVSRDLLGRQAGGEVELPGYVRQIAKQVNSLIRDGDCFQIGAGTTSEPLVLAGALEGKNDLGYHAEATPRGLISLVKKGAINGSRKTVHRHKFVATAIGGGTPEEMAYVDMNPKFELHPGSHTNNVLVIAAHDNFVAINNALAVDLTGQINAEQLGRRTYSVAGGQTAFAIGAILSKGGRSITVLPAAASGGTVSRIVAEHDKGAVITVPRNGADYIVTEYGIASLRDKTRRQRAEALIEIAHPKFRDELRASARELYWP